MKIFILSYENVNQRNINQLHKNLLTVLEILAKFWQNFGEKVEFVTLPGLLVNRKIIK